MKVFVDADACPVVDITVRLCKNAKIECILLCDTAHEMHRESAQTLVFDKGADSVDFALVNRVSPGDIVITQDYGLASMCLAKQASVLHQDGWVYTEDNIGALLFQRHESKRYRMAGGRVKGPSKRRAEQDRAFEAALQQLVQG
ncbi:MAG: YaiI/YqxD family protein [Oscillospiraceae bacterium]|nr:YaiI/YqxD family protein [Oscillospiraceae bacterium]